MGQATEMETLWVLLLTNEQLYWCAEKVQLFVEQILIELKATKAVRSEQKLLDL